MKAERRNECGEDEYELSFSWYSYADDLTHLCDTHQYMMENCSRLIRIMFLSYNVSFSIEEIFLRFSRNSEAVTMCVNLEQHAACDRY